MFIAISRWSCSRILGFGILSLGWALIKTPLGYPIISVSHGDSAVTVLQDQSLCALRQIKDGTAVRVGQHKAQDVHLGGR